MTACAWARISPPPLISPGTRAAQLASYRRRPMTTWTRDELDQIGVAEEVQIAPRRRDGTLRKPVTIWVVRAGDNLYVRAAYGSGAASFRGAQVRREGQIRAGGIAKEVALLDADPNLNDAIDA